MSENIEDTNNYLRLISMFLDLGTETLLKFFLFLVHAAGHNDVSAFLHDATNIRILSKLKDTGALSEKEYDLATTSDPDTKKFDISLLMKLVTKLLGKVISVPKILTQPTDYSVGADLYRLRKYRNTLCHQHHAQMPKGMFDNKWEKISTTLLRIAEKVSVDEKEYLQERISKYKLATFDKDSDVIRLKLDILQEWNREVIQLRKKTEDLIKNLNGFELLLKQTPKRYIRYIKLLIDGGKLVLLGILDRECKRARKMLPDILHQKQEALLKEIANTEAICKLLPPERSEPVPSTWDISVIASVILISFSSSLNQSEVEKIERITDARNQYALTALSLVTQESDDLFEKSTVLIHSLTSLSAGLEPQIRHTMDRMIQRYPNWEIHEDDTVDKYLNELGTQGAIIKSIEDLYKEQMDHLRNTLRQMDENGIHFKRPHEFQIKIVAKCNEEETKRSAEDKLEKVYNTALANDSVDTNLLPANHLEKEVGKMMRRLSDHPDVKVSGIKRNCITLFLSCSTCQGILHVIDYISGQHFAKINCRISDELSYMYGETFVVRGNITLESICGVLKDPRNESGPLESGLSLAIECTSSEGIRHVLSVCGNTETTNGFNQISDMLSSTYETRVSVQGFADLKELSELYEETDTDTSDSSRDHDEDYRLCGQSISGVKDDVKLTYSEDESQTLSGRRIEEESVHTEQINVEDSEPEEKPYPYYEFSKEENGVITEHTYNELQNQESEMDSKVTEDELQFNTNEIREITHTLSEVRNQVNDIRAGIAKEMHLLNVKKSSVAESFDTDTSDSSMDHDEDDRVYRKSISGFKENNDIREIAHILSGVRNQVNNIRTTITKKLHSLNIKKTSVPASFDTDTNASSGDHYEDGRLCGQIITGIKDNVKLTHSQDEAQTHSEKRNEEERVQRIQMTVEDSDPQEKPYPFYEISKEENGVLTEHTYNELQNQESEIDSKVTEDELQFNTNDVREVAIILSEVRNQVNDIRAEIAKEMHPLNTKKTRVLESLDDKEKYDESKELSQSVLSKIDENVYALLKKTLKEVESIVLELTDCVSTWKDNFKFVYVGLANYQEMDEIALRCSQIGRNMHDLRHKILPLLFNTHVDCGWPTDDLDIYEYKLDCLFNDFTQSTFLVTEQDSCFIKMGERQHLPCLTARMLAAENLPQQSNKIEAILLSEQDINDIFIANDDVNHLPIAAKERGLHLASSKIYSTSTRHASFKKMTVKEKYHRKEFTRWEQEYKKKYRIVFTTTIADRRYWTLSLPMTMIHDSVPDKEFLACTSIMWQCCCVDVFKLPLQSDTELLPWTNVEDILQAKFKTLPSVTTLSDANLLYFKDLFFGTRDVPDSCVVSFEEFCINEMEATALTQAFWKWVTNAYKLIEKYLIDSWTKGLILGFISKDDAELYLESFNNMKHGTFILRFSEYPKPNTWNVRNEFVQLSAYVLKITEENVAISYLESTVYRALGEYLDRKDSKAPDPRWLFLAKHCSLPISEKDQKRIKKSAKPGSKFLDQLEKHAYKIPDLADMLRKYGMYDGLDILHSSKIDEDSVLAISENVFRNIGLALEELHEAHESCWYYITNHYDTLNMSRKDQRNIGNSPKPGEKFLEIFNDCKHTLTDLKIVCETFKMQGVLDVFASKRQKGYLQKTLDDVVIGGEMEFREKKLLDILQDKRSPDGSRMLRYIYPGEYTLDKLYELYG